MLSIQLVPSYQRFRREFEMKPHLQNPPTQFFYLEPRPHSCYVDRLFQEASAVMDCRFALAIARRIEIGKAMTRPVEPVRPADIEDQMDIEPTPPHVAAYWEANRAYEKQFEMWELGHSEIVEDEREAKQAALQAKQKAEDAEILALAATKGWLKANPQLAWKVKSAKRRINEAKKTAERIAAIKAEQAARLAKGKAMARPVKPKNFEKLSDEKQRAFYDANRLWREAHPEIVAAEREAEDAAREIERKAEEAEKVKKYPDYPVRPEGFNESAVYEQEDYWTAISAWKP